MIKTPHKIIFITVAAMFLATQAKAVLYWGRPYDPNLQRWIQRDPIAERGGINLPRFVDNNPVNGVDPYGLDLDFIEPGMGASYPATPPPANWSAPNPTGHGVVIMDSSLSAFGIVGGGGGTQTILLDNGQLVSYGYAMLGTGLGAKLPKCTIKPLGAGGGFGMGEVYGVFTPMDYTKWFSSVSGGLVAGGSISGWNGVGSYTLGATGVGVSGTIQYYWIIAASDPISKK
jgi:hypothetical protein